MAESFKTICVCGNGSHDTLTQPIIKAIATAFSVYSQTTGMPRLIKSAFSVTMIANLTFTCTYKTVLQKVNQLAECHQKKIVDWRDKGFWSRYLWTPGYDTYIGLI